MTSTALSIRQVTLPEMETKQVWRDKFLKNVSHFLSLIYSPGTDKLILL